jgi:CRISPR-associated exonuclease Cas4
MFGSAVPFGALWLGRSRRKVTVAIDSELRRRLIDLLASVREARSTRGLPTALYDRRCANCSLINECLPQLVSDKRRVSTMHGMLFAPRGGSGA